MKRYTIGLITGILLTASALTFVAATQSDDRGNRPGRYQGMANQNSVFLLDTQTGDLWINQKGSTWKKRLSGVSQ